MERVGLQIKDLVRNFVPVVNKVFHKLVRAALGDQWVAKAVVSQQCVMDGDELTGIVDK